MKTLSHHSSTRITILLAAAFASSAALAHTPPDAQSQARAVLVSAPVSQAHATGLSRRPYIDAQAQARTVVLGDRPAVANRVAIASTVPSTRIDAQQQAGDVLLGRTHTDPTRLSVTQPASPATRVAGIRQ